MQQQTCPTCRADIAANEARIKKQREREAAAALAEATAEAAAEADLAAAAEVAATPTAEAGGARPTEAGDAAGAARAREGGAPGAAAPGAALRAGWTQHAHNGSPYYRHRELSRSSWDRPGADAGPATGRGVAAGRPDAGAPRPGAPTAPPSRPLAAAGFPCLYRVAAPAGAPLFAPPVDGRPVDAPQRYLPRGKLIVGTALEYWPLPFQEAMVRAPDGFVRSRDVERFLQLSPAPGGEVEAANRKAVGVVR